MMSYSNKAYLKKVAKWDRIIKKWGHLDEALDELYHEGDEIHGEGFIAYMDTITVHRDKRDRDRSCDRHTKKERIGYDVLSDTGYDTQCPTKKSMSLRDIMKEQENEKN